MPKDAIYFESIETFPILEQSTQRPCVEICLYKGNPKELVHTLIIPRERVRAMVTWLQRELRGT